MRILFVTPHPPSRIRVRSYGLIAQLRREHEVTIITQCASEQELADAEILRQQGHDIEVVLETRTRAMLRSGLALFTSVPLQVAYARSERFALAVQRLCEQKTFDVVHVEHLRGMASMERVAQTQPFVWDAVDCISLLFKQAITSGPSLGVRTVAMLDHKRTRKYESRVMQQLQHVVVTSERDRKAMVELRHWQAGNLLSSEDDLCAGVTVLPNGVDLEYFQPIFQESRRYNVVFSGKMSYHANVATALYLYQQIMPFIWEERPEATLTIVGSKPPKSIQQLARDPRVEVTGFVQDMRPYVGGAEVMLSPMVYSVGIQNKVLEAMALGTPTVVAAQAAASLGALPGRDMLVAATAEEFARETLQLMDDAQLRSTLSQNGRHYVEEQHDWSAIAKRLVAVYQQAIETWENKREAGKVPNASG